MAGTTKRAGLVATFDAWSASLDWPELLATATPKAWVGTSLAAVLMVAATQWLPGAPAFFGLDAVGAMLCFLGIPLQIGIVWTVWRDDLGRFVTPGGDRTTPLPRPVVLFWLGASAWVQFFVASLVALSDGPGAWVWVGVMLYAASFHGYLMQSSLRTPYMAVGTLLACLGGIALAEGHSLIAMAVATPGALCGALIAGSARVRRLESWAERDRLREAIRAQQAAEQLKLAVTLEDTLARVLGRGHDAGNTLMGAMLDADALAAQLATQEPLDRASARELAEELRRQLHLVADLTRTMREEASAQARRGIESVDARRPLQEAIRAQQALQPSKSIELEWTAGQAPAVRVTGGDGTLRTVAENLILNGLQGDGRSGATHVRVLVGTADRQLVVRVLDDGPGFPPALAAAPSTAFRTTKPDGTGVGLFTAERLVRASGGEFRFGNRTEGGAEVVFSLPFESTGPDAVAPTAGAPG